MGEKVSVPRGAAAAKAASVKSRAVAENFIVVVQTLSCLLIMEYGLRCTWVRQQAWVGRRQKECLELGGGYGEGKKNIVSAGFMC